MLFREGQGSELGDRPHQEVLRNPEKESHSNNAEIGPCIDKMAVENKVMRSDDIVFIL